MNGKRLDQLLEIALATGAVPPDASESERAALAPLLVVAASVRSGAGVVEAEADATIPGARARFERYLAAQQVAVRAPALATAPRLGRGFASHLRGFGRLVTIRAFAAAAAVVIIALFASQALTSDVPAASAQVLTAGDYVQLEGTVTAQTTDNGVHRVRLASDAGEFEVDVSGDSSVVSGQVPGDVSAVQLGDHILVGGLVNQGGRVGARTLVVAARGDALSQGKSSPRPAAKLRMAVRPLEGTIVSFSLSADLKTARVVLDDGRGGLFLARINRKAAEALLLNSVNALGARVRLVSGGAPGLFSLVVSGNRAPSPTTFGVAGDGTAVSGDPGPAKSTATRTAVPAASTPAATPSAAAGTRATPAGPGAASFVEVKGVIVGRSGDVLRVLTERGLVLVALRADTRILTGDSGATVDALVSGTFNSIGFTVSVAGGLDAKGDRISADLAVLGPKPGQ